MITSSHSITRVPARRITLSLQKRSIENVTWRFSRLIALLIALIAGGIAESATSSASGPVVRATEDVFAADRIDLSRAKPISRRVQQTGYFDQSIGCDVGGFESTCGCETVCDCSHSGGYFGPGCGMEATCGIEASCGAESWIAPGCGCEGVGCDSCCDGYNPTCGCSACCGGMGAFIDCLLPRFRIQWNRLDLFAGVAAHTGPMNFANLSATGTERSGTGSFGFYEGFNKGTSLSFFGLDVAWQSGVRFTQNNLSGSGFTDETRGQTFVTSGFFRTVDYGFQYGLVLDYLYEDWYYRGDLIQLRGELGWVLRNSHVCGFKFAVAVDDDTATTSVKDIAGNVIRNDINFETTDQYRFFYRQQLARYGSCEGFVGWTDNDDGLLGMDLDLPIHGNLLWNTSATYLIPNEGASSVGNQEEGWNLAIGFTYRPGGLGQGSRYSRPLQKVADNGTMMVGRK